MVFHETDMVRALQLIDEQRARLLQFTADLYKAMAVDGREQMKESLAGLIVTVYVLARRLGFDYQRIDEAVSEQLRQDIERNDELEERYGDFSRLDKYLKQKRSNNINNGE